jgi:hypothetical protein
VNFEMFPTTKEPKTCPKFTEYSRTSQCLLDEQRGDQSSPLHLFHFHPITSIFVRAINYSLIRQCDFLPGW